MATKRNDFAAGFCIGGIVFLTIAGLWGIHAGREDFKNELVRSGHAEFFLDAKHQKQWRMKNAQ